MTSRHGKPPGLALRQAGKLVYSRGMPAKKKVADGMAEEQPTLTPFAEEPKKKRAYVRKPKAADAEGADAPAPKKRAPRKAAQERAFAAEPIAAAQARPDAVYLDGTPAVSVVIPAYNEAERIAPTLVEAHAYFGSLGVPFEVLVVDDGSSDRTPEIVERMGNDFRQLRLVRMEKNGGKGAAVACGMLEAKGAVRLFADADGSTPFAEYEKLAAALAAGADVAFGSRALKESVVEPKQPLIRRVLGKGSNLVVQATNLPGVRDSQCGFKAFTADAAEAVFPHLTQYRWGFDIEALVLARRLRLRIAEVAIRWQDRAGSNLGLFRPGAYLQTFGEDLRIRYNALTGAYPKR